MTKTSAIIMVTLATLATGGCLGDAQNDWYSLLTDGTSSASSSSSTTDVPTPPTTGSGIQTVTGPPDETTSTTTTTTTTDPGTTGTPEEHVPPTIELKAVPDHLSEAGTSKIELTSSDDQVKVRLYLDGVLLGDLTLADFPYTYQATSAKDNLPVPRVFRVEVEDAEGFVVSDEANLTVQVPASGTEKCLFEDKTAGASMIWALAYTETAIVAVGARDNKATAWLFDPDACDKPLPGWPKTIANWTTDMTLASLPSRASAVAVDDDGNMALGINVTKNGRSQRYVVFINSKGATLWEKPGGIGETVSGIAITPEGYVIAVGWAETSQDPVHTDAMIWRHNHDGMKVTLWPTALKAPFTPDEFEPDKWNEMNEWARGVLYHPELDLLFVFGDREFKPDGFNIYLRAWVASFVPFGLQVGKPWTSSGDPLMNDGANAIALCGEDILLGGWTRDKPPGALPQPLTRWIGADGISTQRVVEPMLGTQTYGVGCDRAGKIVSAATSSMESSAKVFAFEDPLGSRTWYEQGSPGNDAASALACDARGMCAWGGFRTLGGKPVAVVRVHHP